MGFATEAGSLVNLKEEIQNIVHESSDGTNTKKLKDSSKTPEKDTNEKDDCKLAVYVNQWRWRSVMNQTRNLEFFYNSSSLSADSVYIKCFT